MFEAFDKQFQKAFKEAMEVKWSWEGMMSFQMLDDTLEEDKELYKDEEELSLFLSRRNSAKLYSDSKKWSKLVFGAFWEIVNGQEGEAVNELRRVHLYNSLCDFVYHINYFEIVRKIMEERGERVYTFGYNHSCIHDIDKLHPVMLVACAEKFDDQKDTSLWNLTLKTHIQINSHHQGNSLWSEKSSCSEDLKNVALAEMICDKVSRRLQKNLKGKLDQDMWNVESKYFDGLPSSWISKATQIIAKLSHSE